METGRWGGGQGWAAGGRSECAVCPAPVQVGEPPRGALLGGSWPCDTWRRGDNGRPGGDAQRRRRALRLSCPPCWPQGWVSPGLLPRLTPCPLSLPPWGGDPAVPPHVSAVSTLSDTFRKMSASKKLWITGSSAKEGRSREGLGAPSLGLWDFSSQGGGGQETSLPSSVSGSAGNSLPHWEAQSFNKSDKAVFSIDTGRLGLSLGVCCCSLISNTWELISVLHEEIRTWFSKF